MKVLEKAEIIDAGSEGNAVARYGEMVVFVPFAVPGDIVDIEIIRKKRSFAEGRIVRFHGYSKHRVEPFCSHFGICGGCRWQQMSYESQLFFKQKQVEDNLQRIGKIISPQVRPILASPLTRSYRNKLEFTFSSQRWHVNSFRKSPIVPDEAESLQNQAIDTSGLMPEDDSPALGFHIPKRWDKVLDIDHCYLMKEPVNAIRLEVRRYSIEKGLSFYNARIHDGLLRNMIMRNTGSGDFMLVMVFGKEENETIFPLLDHIRVEFPEITSLYYVINEKKNDIISDLKMNHYYGSEYLTEIIPAFREGYNPLNYRIGPVSFYQTNPEQASRLFRQAAVYLDPAGTESVYDLYTGTGTIANYIAPYVHKVIGIESVLSAIEDAKVNAIINQNTNSTFISGEAEKVLIPEFISIHGRPDVVITDPPRSGMHEKVLQALLKLLPQKIIYISCNPATQARDIRIMKAAYDFAESQPVDMFPHTQHVENVALLTLSSKQAD
jgi:23S rRNA (uracil1939-C5)-methyltransferase